jgi:cytochrome b561
MAIIIIGLFVLGEYMVDLDYYDQWYQLAPWWHKSFGLSIFMLLVIRLVWKLTNITPESLASYKSWEIKSSKIVHTLFYVLLFITCISGYFISTAKGVSFDFFNMFKVPSIIILSETQAEQAGNIHEIATYGLLVLFILHFFAALKHHFINKDKTLIRMLKPIIKN